MLPKKSLAWGRSKSCIRELAAYGTQRKAEIGAENVYDFSIGNPSVPAPAELDKAIYEVLAENSSTVVHGYTAAVGLPSLRKAIADDLNKRYDANVDPNLIYVTCGAAAGLVASTHGLVCEGEEVIAFAPFFPEYRVFTESAGGKLVAVPPKADLQPDFEAFEKTINEKTKLVIINSPNNPSGVILTVESIEKLCAILRAAEEKYGHPIFVVADEPYRELVYDGSEVPCIHKHYKNSIICYSWSKSLSVPGERIGYLAVNSAMEDKELVFASLAGAARGCGYVNPPSMMQRVIEKCIGLTSDVSEYKKNRDLLYDGLKALNFDCVKPDGAFYLFVKTPVADAKEFSEQAKKYELLLVPSDDFGVPGYVRLAYCVSAETIKNSMPAFEKLAKEYGLI